MIKDTFNKNLQSFLFENEILPLTKWNHFYVNHKHGVDEEDIRSVIKKSTNLLSGVYVYQRINNEVLFVGKSKNLEVNLFRHYKASQGVISGDANSKPWHRFFSQYQEELIIYWMEIDDEIQRDAIGEVLRYILKPLYNLFE